MKKLTNKQLALVTLFIVPAFGFGLSLKYIDIHYSTQYNIHVAIMFICCAISGISAGTLLHRMFK
jgi:hypothetical protein